MTRGRPSLLRSARSSGTQIERNGVRSKVEEIRHLLKDLEGGSPGSYRDEHVASVIGEVRRLLLDQLARRPLALGNGSSTEHHAPSIRPLGDHDRGVGAK